MEQVGRVHFTGEQIAFAALMGLVVVVFFLTCHSGIRRLFMVKNQIRPGYSELWYTGIAAWTVTLLFIAAIVAIPTLWWFGLNGTGLRPDFIHWMRSNGWNPY